MDWKDSPAVEDVLEPEPQGSRPRRHARPVQDAEALDAWHAQPTKRLAADLTCTITYVASDGEITTRRITIREVMERAGCVYLVAVCHERHAVRHFRLDGVRACWDSETGEVIDLPAYIETLDPVAEPAPADTKPRKARRTEDLGPFFDAIGCPKGWVFDVPPAFRAALDIELSTLVDRQRTKQARARDPKAAPVLRRAWTRGVPPRLAFERGHVLYERGGPVVEGGRDWLRGVRRLVQVRDAQPDTLERDGWVLFELWPVERSELGESSLHRCSQAAFEAFLRDGVLPG